MSILSKRDAVALAMVLIAICSPQLWGQEQDAAARAYKFGVFPYLSTARLESIYAPVSVAMSQALDRPVQFRTAAGFEQFFGRLRQQHYDIALIQPFWYPPAIDRFGYRPLVRVEEPLTSVIMVRDGSPLRSVEDLRGKNVATPPNFGPVVHMARRALRERGLMPGRDLQLTAFKSVDSCFQQLLIGTASACVSGSLVPPLIEKRLNVRLRTLLETPPIPGLSLVVNARMPDAERERLNTSLLAWHVDYPQLLDKMGTRALVPTIDAEYDVVRTFLVEIESR